MTAALKLVHSKINSTGKCDYINHFAQSEPRVGVLFTDFITKMVKQKAKRVGPSYVRNYRTLIYHLNGFSELHNATIYTNSVNEHFLDDFITYLEEKDLKLGYIKNLLSLIKSMVKKAGTYGYMVDRTYDVVELEDDIPFSVYLSMNEITRIYYFIGLSPKKERIKDLFVLGCLTGLRYSDYSTLKKDNFKDDYIIKITKKTRKKVTIPLHDYVKEIIQKYNGELPTNLSIQHFNRYIKQICRQVGLTDKITHSYTRGGEIVTETKEKWELIKSHTARRSAATNMYLTRRMSTFEIMQITGHTTEKSFFRYIRISEEDSAKQVAGDTFFRK